MCRMSVVRLCIRTCKHAHAHARAHTHTRTKPTAHTVEETSILGGGACIKNGEQLGNQVENDLGIGVFDVSAHTPPLPGHVTRATCVSRASYTYHRIRTWRVRMSMCLCISERVWQHTCPFQCMP